MLKRALPLLPSSLRVGLAAALLLLLAGCATTWSDADRAKLAQVSVPPATATKDAYQKPSAKVSPGMANSIPMATGGGLIPSLIGSAIDATVMAKQQGRFEEKNAQYFDQIKSACGEPPVQLVTTAVNDALQQHAFFGSRLAAQSDRRLVAEIESYGFTHAGETAEKDILLNLSLTVKFTLKIGRNEELFNGRYVGYGRGAKLASEIAADPAFVEASAQEAAHSVANQLVAAFDAKLAKK